MSARILGFFFPQQTKNRLPPGLRTFSLFISVFNNKAETHVLFLNTTLIQKSLFTRWDIQTSYELQRQKLNCKLCRDALEKTLTGVIREASPPGLLFAVCLCRNCMGEGRSWGCFIICNHKEMAQIFIFYKLHSQAIALLTFPKSKYLESSQKECVCVCLWLVDLIWLVCP